jgi:hypothetical protein
LRTPLCREDLNRYCCDLIGLDPMPRVPMPPTPFHPDAEVPAVDAYVGDRAVAWLDEEFGKSVRLCARTRRAPTLLVDVDPSIGLTAKTVSTLGDWPRSYRADEPSSP